MFKKKYYVIFVSKQQNVYNFVKKRRIYATTERISYRNQNYFINTETPTWQKKFRVFYLVDIHSKQLTTKLIDNSEKTETLINGSIKLKDVLIDKTVVDKIIGKSIILQLVSLFSNTQTKTNLMIAVGCLAIGGLLGYLIGGL